MGFSRPENRSGSHSLLQGIFKTQELNPGLLRCRWILYHLSCQVAIAKFLPVVLLSWCYKWSGIADAHEAHCLFLAEDSLVWLFNSFTDCCVLRLILSGRHGWLSKRSRHQVLGLLLALFIFYIYLQLVKISIFFLFQPPLFPFFALPGLSVCYIFGNPA